jgi:putative Holliday junction resolvase
VKVAGIDFGKARVGVAVSDDLGMMAHPRPSLEGRNRRALLQALNVLAQSEQLTKFVVGLPLEMTGERGPAADRAIAFAQQLADLTHLEVELQDERLTTVQANRHLAASEVRRAKRRHHIDAASAVVILQAWLDANASRG